MKGIMESDSCTWKFWQLQCPRSWSGLRKTDDPDIRLCESCLQNVHLYKTEEEVDLRSRQGECVALNFPRGPQLLGKVLPKT